MRTGRLAGWIIVIVLGAVMLVVGMVGWQKWRSQNSSKHSENCAAVQDNEKRFECYSKDGDADLLKRAIAQKNLTLCDTIDHVFIAHDVQSEIKKGNIGQVISGDKAKQLCKDSVWEGHQPSSG